MEPEDYLLGFSEISLGFLGFSSVVLVLGWRSENWTPLDRTRMVGLFSSSAGALFLSLLALVLAAAGVPEPQRWGISSGLMVVYSLAAVMLGNQQLKTLGDRDLERFQAPLGRVVVYISLGGIPVQGLNAFGALPVDQFAVFYFGLVWFLVFAVYTLGRALFAR